jgi:Xaa-Pro aminopeptidase
MRKHVIIITLALIALADPIGTQQVRADVFPPEEFAARRAKVIEQIGEGIAILQGTTERPGEQPLRQSNQFFYLTGVVEPRALLVIDGRAKRSTLFLFPRNERRERAIGPTLFPSDEAVRATGIEAVRPRDEFSTALAEFARDRRIVFTPFRGEVLGNASASDVTSSAKATKDDPWDGRPSREEAFIQKLKVAAPQSDFRDLDPILDVLRAVKSPREIEIIREATHIAGLGIMEAMRDTRPGMREYELQADAEFVFKKHGSQGAAYFALVATGKNTIYSHYHKGLSQLEDGDLVQFDYAPDYQYYVSDVTRVFPANGRFNSWQREWYTIYLRLYQALMTSIKVDTAPRDIMKEAVVKMDVIMSSYKFTDPKIKEAATRFVERYRSSKSTSLGHTVGMEVHDVRLPNQKLVPGNVFTIEPAMTIPDLHMGFRLEDVILITKTGYENLSAFVPFEINDIEKLMAKPGLSDIMLKTPAR